MVAIEIYDDPVNPHGWGVEPMVRRLRVECPDADWRVHPTTLVETWERYDGPEFPRGRQRVPATCSRVSEETGMPIDEYLWFDDPPSTSRPACAGIAAVTDPGSPARTRLVRAAREATMLHQTNLDSMAAVRELVATTLGPDRAAAVPATADAGPVPDGDELGDVPGVEWVGDRPRLPTVVATAGADRRGVSGAVDVGALRELVAAVTGETPTPRTDTVAAAIDRFSPAGWLCGAELVAVTGRPYQETLETATALADVTTREFAAEPFVRATEHL